MFTCEMKHILVAILFGLVPFGGLAQTMTLNPGVHPVNDGKVQFAGAQYAVVYESFTLKRVDPDGVYISHKTGFAKIPYELLPADLLAKYVFDPAQAEAFRAQQKAASLKQGEADLAARNLLADKAKVQDTQRQKAQEFGLVQVRLRELEDLAAARLNKHGLSFKRGPDGQWNKNPVTVRYSSIDTQDLRDEYYRLKSQKQTQVACP